MKRRFATADVFTDLMFGGNTVAVVLDAGGLSTKQMQVIASEFNVVETTFVLPPNDSSNDAHVRIFTPDREMPFAGHASIGTAFVMAQDRASRGETIPDSYTLEMKAGLVRVQLMREGSRIVGGELLSPEPLSQRSGISLPEAAATIGLSKADVRTEVHQPLVASVGLPFLILELHSREALARALPDRRAYDNLFPLEGAKAVYAYTRDTGSPEFDLRARMFTGRMVEDPATGSAAAALMALLAEVDTNQLTKLRIAQGFEMGRPSLLLARAFRDETTVTAYVAGLCVKVFEGSFVIAGEERPQASAKNEHAL